MIVCGCACILFLFICECNILFIGSSNHWVCACKMGRGSVMVMDSLSLFKPLNEASILQIANIYNQSIPPSQSLLPVESLSVQQQQGALDCGLFAVAFATEICYGKNPETVVYDQKKMRNHLYQWFNSGELTVFPKTSPQLESLPRPSKVKLNISLYCHCRMPEEYDDVMVCCDTCNRWYHTKCVDTDTNDIELSSWSCHKCV